MGHWRGMEKKDVRIQLVISPSEVEALDAWRQERRIWSRSAAIRQLIADGVKKAPKAREQG
jgi:metal-responsive CopG/Arc/MetJ family transcriptional regulator